MLAAADRQAGWQAFTSRLGRACPHCCARPHFILRRLLTPAVSRSLPSPACCSACWPWHIRSSGQQLAPARFSALQEAAQTPRPPLQRLRQWSSVTATSTHIACDLSQSAQYTFARSRGTRPPSYSSPAAEMVWSVDAISPRVQHISRASLPPMTHVVLDRAVPDHVTSHVTLRCACPSPLLNEYRRTHADMSLYLCPGLSNGQNSHRPGS